MKKTYEQPKLNIEVIELDDVIAASGAFGENQAGDTNIGVDDIWNGLF